MIIFVITHVLLALVVWLITRRIVKQKPSVLGLSIHQQLSFTWGKT